MKFTILQFSLREKMTNFHDTSISQDLSAGNGGGVFQFQVALFKIFIKGKIATFE